MKKDKKTEGAVYTLDPFVEWSHRVGRAFILCFIAYSILIPTIISIVFHAWPSFGTILPPLIPILGMLGFQGAVEAGMYTPILGSSCYLTFATGNVMNLKIPCVLNAQKIAGVETNTTAGDAIALIATCVSSIVTMVILFAGLFLAIPLRPFLQSEVASSASNYLMAALFGCLALSLLAPSGGKTVMKNKLLIVVVPFVLTAILIITGMAKPSTAMMLVLAAIPLCILIARILYKKGIVRIETKS